MDEQNNNFIENQIIIPLIDNILNTVHEISYSNQNNEVNLETIMEIDNSPDETSNINQVSSDTWGEYSNEQLTDYNNVTSDNWVDNSEGSDEVIVNNINLNNSQYAMLHDNNDNNPFFKCNINELNYETDDEINDNIRIIYTWNYEFNYDYFTLNELNIYISKNAYFKNNLIQLKKIRNSNMSNITGEIIKLENNINLKIDEIVNIYLILYYDNAKTNIKFYGVYSEELEQNKLIDNIKLESKFGNKGIVSTNNVTNLGDNDFIILHKKVKII